MRLVKLVPWVAAGLLMVVGVSAAGAKHRPPRHCRPASAARCLRSARGVEPVAVGANGRVSRTAALQGFASVFGLPGVRPAPGATGTLFSGSGLVRWLGAYRSSLTASQRRQYDAIVRGDGGAVARAATAPDAATLAKFKAFVAADVSRIGTHLGVALTLPSVVKLMPEGSKGEKEVYALTGSDDGGSTCNLDFYKELWKGLPDDEAQPLVAHEVFHCFEIQVEDYANYLTSGLGWLDEGGADWAGYSVAAEVTGAPAHGKSVAKTWAQYLKAPATPLFSRTYSAVGWWSQLGATGSDVWKVLLDAMKAHEQTAAYAAAGKAFLESWASGFFRDPSLGAGWDATGPGITADHPAPPKLDLPEGSSRGLVANARASAIATLDMSGDVLELSTSGPAHGRLRDADGALISLPGGAGAYCMRDGGCKDGPSGCPDLPQIAPGHAQLALSADTAPATLTLRSRSLDAYCKEPKRPKPGAGGTPASHLVASGAVGATGTTSGDCSIHHETFLLSVFLLEGAGGKAYYVQLSTEHYGGPGVYAADGRGVTSGPTVDFTDGLGNAWQTEDMPDGEGIAGGFTVNDDERTGTVSATLNSAPQGGGTTEMVAGSWSCKLDRYATR